MRTRGSGGHNSASRARVYTRRKIAIKLQAVQIDINLYLGEPKPRTAGRSYCRRRRSGRKTPRPRTAKQRDCEQLDRVTASNSAGIYPKGGKTRRRNCARAKIKKDPFWNQGRELFFTGTINKRAATQDPAKDARPPTDKPKQQL